MSEWGVDYERTEIVRGADPLAAPTPPAPRPDRSWLIAIVLVIAVLGILVFVFGSPFGEKGSNASATIPTTTTVAPTTTVPDPAAEQPVPTDKVAYLGSGGQVLVGNGAETPVEIASGAALGATKLGAVAVAPTGDVVAYIRQDGALVTVPITGGEPAVVATDAALTDIGERTGLAWNPTGSQLAYLAVGTADMVEPRSDVLPPLSSDEGVYRVPLPDGTVLGNVVKVVERDGTVLNRLGDPSTRSMVSIASSTSDDFLVLESVNPEDGKPYTLSMATSLAVELSPTVLSGDEPTFSPDGNFVIAVGPDKSGQELIRVATDSFGRTTLASADRICAPSVSPDNTRIVYGSGPDCSKLMLISAVGGTPVEITPPLEPGSVTFKYGELSWTAEGQFVVFADCRSTDGPVTCGGPVKFLDPDRRVIIPGADATTVATVDRPLLGDLTLSVILAGPIEYQGTFAIDAAAEAEFIQGEGDSSTADVVLTNGDQRLELHLLLQDGGQFTTGQMTVVDPAKGINRTFLVLASPSVIGVRVVSLTGIWMVTDDLPFVTGEFRLAVRRG